MTQREYLSGESNEPFDRKQACRFADFAGVLIVMLDLEGRVSLINRTACRVLEAGAESDVVGVNWFDRFVPEDLRKELRHIYDRLMTGEMASVEFFENPVRTASGAKRTIQWHNTTVRGPRGSLLGTLSVGIDVTERREIQARADARAAQLDAFFTTAVDGLITIDERGIIESASPACERMFEYDLAELVGENVRILMAFPDAARHDDYLRHYLQTGERKVIGTGREVIARKKSGALFPVFIAVSEIRVGGERKFTGIVRDMTDLKNAQHALLKQESLARVGELASVVAHEVRNPLAGIGGALRILQGRLVLRSDESEVIDEILARLDQLGRTVDDLLVFARPRMPHIQQVPLSVLLEETLSLLAEAPDFRSVRVKVECPESVRIAGDPEMLKPVFQNVFLNAAQAMAGAGELTVVTEVEPALSRVTVRVCDTGPGIPEAHREKVFEPFFSTKGTGTGLGLSIASRTLDLHGGEIAIASPSGSGAVVTIRLPLADVSPQSGADR